MRAVLGEGACGLVYLAFDPELEREVAIKVPRSEGFTPEFREVFLRENRLAAIIHHANVCPIYEVGTDGALPYIVMRYVAGGTLAGLLKRFRAPVPAKTAVSIARKLALGLVAAHAQKVIHRDLKPANVLYDEANREVLIADFGLARFVDQSSASSAGVPKGTPAYMSPEQARGLAAVIGPHSDVYSLGVILYEMLTGRAPFDGSIWEVMRDHCETPPRPPSALRPGLDAKVDALCLKAMAKKPEDRFRTARDFAAALAEYLHGSNAGEADDLVIAEEIVEPSNRRRDGSSPATAFEIEDDETDAPSAALRETRSPAGATRGSGPQRAPAPKPEEPGEVLLCPKCKSRLQVRAGRTKPVDCPMCNCRFAVAAGRQAAARSPEPKARANPPGDGRRKQPRAARWARDEDSDARGDWQPAARGLRLAWLSEFVTGLLLFGVVATAIVAHEEDAALTTKSISSATKSTSAERGPTGSGVRPASATVFHNVYSVLCAGLAVAWMLVGLGRYRAGRLPAGVGGSGRATLSALAAWLAVPCLAAPFLLAAWMPEETVVAKRTTSEFPVVPFVAVGAGFLLLLASEFAFNSYLAAIGRQIGRGVPQSLTTVATAFLWVLLSCTLFGGGAAGIAVAIDVPRADSGFAFFGLMGGAAFCLSLVILPFWGLISFWLHVHAAVAVGQHARGGE